MNEERTEGEQQSMLTTRELAERAGVSVRFIEKHRSRLPGAVKVGARWRYRRVAIERALLGGSLLLPVRQG